MLALTTRPREIVPPMSISASLLLGALLGALNAAAALWNLACDDEIRPHCMDAIDPLVAMAHECHSVDARRRAAVALDCLMAYESFERDWHLEKLNQPVIDRVKLAVTNENEKLIQQMISDCDAADRRGDATQHGMTREHERGACSPRGSHRLPR